MILITGGMGFIGLHTARRFLDAGESVVITQFTQRREPDFIKDELGKRVMVERLDVTAAHDVVDIVRKHEVTGIIHLAVPGLAALSPAEDYRVNMQGFINVLEAARLSDVRRVTYASSIAVYTGLKEGPFHEDAPLPLESGNSTEAYKKAWEVLGSHYAARSGLEVVAARASGIWGPLYHSMANLPSRVCHAAARGIPANFAGARGGVPYEDDEGDFCYVKDCALGLYLLQTAANLAHRAYNIGGGTARTNADLVAAARKVVPTADIPLQPGKSARNRPQGYVDITRATQEIGYVPQYTLESAVEEYIGWLRANPV